MRGQFPRQANPKYEALQTLKQGPLRITATNLCAPVPPAMPCTILQKGCLAASVCTSLMTSARAYQTCRLSLTAHTACSRRSIQGWVRLPREAYLSLRLAGCCHGRSRLLLEHELARLELLLLHRPCHCTGICMHLAPTDGSATYTRTEECCSHERHITHMPDFWLCASDGDVSCTGGCGRRKGPI